MQCSSSQSIAAAKVSDRMRMILTLPNADTNIFGVKTTGEFHFYDVGLLL